MVFYNEKRSLLHFTIIIPSTASYIAFQSSVFAIDQFDRRISDIAYSRALLLASRSISSKDQ